MPESNKRRSRRIETELPLTWRGTFTSTAYNISMGGLYFQSSHPPTVGDRIEIAVNLPDTGETIQTQGIVRWTSTHAREGAVESLFGVGVEFDDVDQITATILESWLKKNTEQQRQHKRLPARIVVDYQFAGQKFRAIAKDISMNGMFLVCNDVLQLGDMIHLHFELPGSQILTKTRAIVRWRHDDIPKNLAAIIPPGMGVEFIDTAADDRALIQAFVDRQSKA